MEIINYKSLVADYTVSLNTQLRGFRPAAEFLDTWVPDASHEKSILNLVEAAELAGKDQLSIQLDNEVLENLNRTELIKLLSEIGKAHFVEDNGRTLLNISLKSSNLSGDDAQTPYLQKLKSLPLKWDLEEKNPSRGTSEQSSDLGPLKAGQTLLYVGETADSKLWCEINPSTHQITRANFSAQNLAMKSLLQLFCESITGLPIQEAADHGVLKLEFFLRPDDQKWTHGKGGIITAQNADPMFQKVLTLIRQVFEKYKKHTGHQPGTNFFDRQPNQRWIQLNQTERIHSVQSFTDKNLTKWVGPENRLKVARTDLENDIRIFFEWEGPATSDQKAFTLFHLERALNKEVEPRLELFLEELKDKNTKRRL